MTMVAEMDAEQGYREAFLMLRTMIKPMDVSALAATCTHCPEWSIRDVVSHVAAVLTGIVIAEPVPEFGRQSIGAIVEPEQSVRQDLARQRDERLQLSVDALRDLPMPELFADWEAVMDRAGPEHWPRPQADLAVHLGDIEETLGVALSRDSALHTTGLQVYGAILGQRLAGFGVETVRLRTTDTAVEIGDSESPHIVSGSGYELLRTVTGRRTREEADLSLDWGTTPEATRAAFAVYDWR